MEGCHLMVSLQLHFGSFALPPTDVRSHGYSRLAPSVLLISYKLPFKCCK